MHARSLRRAGLVAFAMMSLATLAEGHRPPRLPKPDIRLFPAMLQPLAAGDPGRVPAATDPSPEMRS